MPFHNNKQFRNKVKKLTRVRKTFTRIRKDLKDVAKDPIEASHIEVKQEQKNEEIQQADIDKEKELIKKDIDTEELNESSIKAKMNAILNQLPANDKLRQLMDEKKLEKNNNNFKSKLSIKS